MTEIPLIVVSGIGSAAVTVALLYSARQTRTLKAQFELDNDQAERSLTTQRAGNDLKLMELVMALDRLFIEEPGLRQYFYDGREIPDDELTRTRVIATAEYIIDLADSVANMIRLEQLDLEDQEAWAIALKWYGRSPAVRLVAKQGAGAWRQSTLALLLADEGETTHPVVGTPLSSAEL
jgi:hypothetical protein